MGYLTSAAWQSLLEIVADSLSDSMRFAEIYHVDRFYAEKAIRSFTTMKDMAALGNKNARQNIVDYYIRLLESKNAAEVNDLICRAVDFCDISKNEPDVIFELLMADFSFEEIIREYREYSNEIALIDGEILRCVGEHIEQKFNFLSRYDGKRERLNFICTLLYAISYGQSCIETLQYMDINEIGILNKDYIYVIYKGIKIRLKFLSFDNAGTVINIQKKTTQKSALNYDMQNPMLITSKNNSNRISVAGYDMTPGDEDYYYNERIFNLNVTSLEDIKEKYNTIDDKIIEFLKYNQRGRGSFIVSGSDMGIGKSTFLLSMIGEYPTHLGIGILDQQNELQIGLKYPEKNVITIVENTKRDLAQSFAYLLKTSRDILVVSEITLPEEVSELVNSALRLNAGVSATMHSFSPYEVIPNLRNLMLKTPMYKDKNTAEEDIAGCIDLIIHLGRLSNGRIVVESIHEVFFNDIWKNEYLNERCLSEYKEEKEEYHTMQKTLMKLGIRYLQSMILGKQYTLRPIFVFNKERGEGGLCEGVGTRNEEQVCKNHSNDGTWEIVNVPSEQYFNKMSRYAGEKFTEEIKRIFK